MPALWLFWLAVLLALLGWALYWKEGKRADAFERENRLLRRGKKPWPD